MYYLEPHLSNPFITERGDDSYMDHPKVNKRGSSISERANFLYAVRTGQHRSHRGFHGHDFGGDTTVSGTKHGVYKVMVGSGRLGSDGVWFLPAEKAEYYLYF